jgi:hypothetical protein
VSKFSKNFSGRDKMKNKVLLTLLAGIFVFGLLSLAQAGKPQDSNEVFLGNGFPSGPHFNLNIKAHKDDFNCPNADDVMKGYCPDDQKTYSSVAECDAVIDTIDVCASDCIAVYGNVINFPETGIASNSKLLMESGQEGSKGKAKKEQTTPSYPDLLEVTDMCLGFEANDNAAFRIPADPDGYAVYARTTGDPKYSPEFDFSDPELYYVQNFAITYDCPDQGNIEVYDSLEVCDFECGLACEMRDADVDYLALGYITSDGVFDVDGNPISIPAKERGNKLPKATEITSLFMWSGEVCFLYDNGEGGQTDKCCTDNVDTLDPEFNVGVCVDPFAVECCIDPNDQNTCNGIYDTATLTCPAGYTKVVDCSQDSDSNPLTSDYYATDAWCITYGDDPETQIVEESEWVFNIADFVGLFFKLNSNGHTGSSLLQIRFYPLPLDIGTSGNPH